MLALKVGETGDYNEYLQSIEVLVQKLYDYGLSESEFKEQFKALIVAQLMAAYNSAWFDTMDTDEIPDYLDEGLREEIKKQYGYVNRYYEDIVKARGLAMGIALLLSRASLWAGAVVGAYSNAILQIATVEGPKPDTPILENLVWRLGATEQHCKECYSLNGIVASAGDWGRSGFRPQMPPNEMLSCGGWRCDCSLLPSLEIADADAAERLNQIAAGI